MRIALAEIDEGPTGHSSLFPRLEVVLVVAQVVVPQISPGEGGGKIPKAQLQRRMEAVASDVQSVTMSRVCRRAEALVHMGELSAARQALEGAVSEPVEASPHCGIRSFKTFWKWSQEVLLCWIQSCLPATFEVRDAELQQAPQA